MIRHWFRVILYDSHGHVSATAAFVVDETMDSILYPRALFVLVAIVWLPQAALAFKRQLNEPSTFSFAVGC
jgi:hypothetical protein